MDRGAWRVTNAVNTNIRVSVRVRVNVRVKLTDTKQFSHERMEWAVKKDPSPGIGRTKAKYTHTPCCPPRVL